MNLKHTPLFLFLLIFTNLNLFSQIGIGTLNPVAGSSLHIEGSNSGIMINRVALTGTDDSSTISPVGASQEGLLVYNTSTISNINPDTDVSPGFYFWTGSKWQSMVAHLPGNLCLCPRRSQVPPVCKRRRRKTLEGFNCRADR